MATVEVLTQQAQPNGTVDLNDDVFNVEVREHLFHQVVRQQLAARRSASPSTKTRSLVSGGGRKPYRQKGTGRARQGSTRSPHFRGGGVVFGPDGQNHNIALTKKFRRAALKSALSLRFQQGNLIVLDSIALDGFKTKGFVGIMSALGLESALIIDAGAQETVVSSARNLPKVRVLEADGLNVYDILRHKKLVVTLPAIERIQQRFA